MKWIPTLPAPSIVKPTPFKQWVRVLLVIILVAVIPLISFPLKGLKHDFSDACTPEHVQRIKTNLTQALWLKTNLTAGLELVNTSRQDLDTLIAALSTSTYACTTDKPASCPDPSGSWSYPNWPDGCSLNMAAAAAEASKNQKCEKEKCAKFLGLFKVACARVEVPCPAPTAFQQESALGAYAKQQELLDRNTTPSIQVYSASDPQENAMWKAAIDSVQSVVDLATYAYSIYLACSIWYGAPFRYHRRRSWKGKVHTMLLGLSQHMFILVFIIAWYVVHVVKHAWDAHFVNVVWSASLTAPCLISSEVSNMTATEVASVCNEVAAARISFTSNVHNITSVQASAGAYSACYLPCWSCQANFDISSATYATEQVSQVFVGIVDKPAYDGNFVFPATCDLSELSGYVKSNMRVWAEATDVNSMSALFRGGILSALLIKFMICRLIFSVAVLLEPLVAHAQGVEYYGDGSSIGGSVADNENNMIVCESMRVLRFRQCWPFALELVALPLMAWNLSQAKVFWKE